MTTQPSFLNTPNYKYQNDDDSSNFHPTYVHIGFIHMLGELRDVRLYRYYTERDQVRVVADFGDGENYMDFDGDNQLDFSLLLTACMIMNYEYDSARGQGVSADLMNIFYTERNQRSYEITKREHLEKIKVLSWADLIEGLHWRSMTITFLCAARHQHEGE
jgi:hypothetical protein